MKYYIEQRHNPNKHQHMPNEYPWQESSVPTNHQNEIAISVHDYDLLINSLDLNSYKSATEDSIELRQQRAQRLWGEKYVPTAIDLVGAKNLELTKAGIIVNTTTLLQSMGVVKELLNTGALKTARNVCIQLQPAFIPYADTFNKMIADINTFLYENGY
jgi:hypothetical protein